MTTSGGASLTQREIEEHVARLHAALDHADGNSDDMARLSEVAERLGLLRMQYRAHPKSLNGYLPKLKELSRRFEALLDARLPAVVDRYHEIAGQIRRAELEREYWRHYLIGKAPAARSADLNGAAAVVTIRATETRVLPSAGSDSRVSLDRLVQQTGHWDEVSQLSRTKLHRALGASLFGPEQSQAISKLCPFTVVHQVSSRTRTA